jgi:hypothetical protein
MASLRGVVGRFETHAQPPSCERGRLARNEREARIPPVRTACGRGRTSFLCQGQTKSEEYSPSPSGRGKGEGFKLGQDPSPLSLPKGKGKN